MTKRTRLKITIVTGLYLMALGILSEFKGMENAAIACIAALTGAVLGYIWGETKKPSSEN